MGPIVLRILFIGNSLTAGHNLPAVVEALARADEGVRIETRAVTFPDHSLEDHWNRPEARRAIASGKWDVVVLQQGPSALPESQRLLREYTRRFNREIAKAGARTALYMVWPSKARSFDFDGVEASYRRAAEDVNGLLLPVGTAWRAASKRDPSLALYGPDAFHAAPAGTLLAALVIYQQVTGRSAAGLASPFSSIDPAVVSVLQGAAVEACGPRRPPGPGVPFAVTGVNTANREENAWDCATSTATPFRRRRTFAWTDPRKSVTGASTSTAPSTPRTRRIRSGTH